MKMCAKCGLEKPLDEFYRQTAGKDGLGSYCKLCVREYAKQWRYANPERHKANVARWCKEHPEQARAGRARWRKEHPKQVKAQKARHNRKHAEQCKARAARWAKEHPERCRAAARRYYENHKEEVRARAACWAKTHPEKRSETQRHYQEKHRERLNAYSLRWQKEHPEKGRRCDRRRRARKQAVSENFTSAMEQFTHEFWGHQCAVCGRSEKLCVDHWLPLSGGHALTMANAVLLCAVCNCSKNAKLPSAVYNHKFVKTVERQLRKQAQQWLTVANAT